MISKSSSGSLPGKASRLVLLMLGVAVSSISVVTPVTAAVTASEGYIHDVLVLPTKTQSCVAAGRNGTFVGTGPAFTANAQSIVFAGEAGDRRTVATGFTSIADCVYDMAGDVLYVADNADSGDVVGATTGDTIFRIPAASTATNLAAKGLELLPANTLPAVASLALDAEGNLFASNANGPGAGTVIKIAAGTTSMSTLASNFDYTAGLAFEPTTGNLFVGEARASFQSQITELAPTGTVLGTLAGPSSSFGAYDAVFGFDGALLTTGNSTISAFNNVGARSTFASGFAFSTGITADPFTGRIEALDSFSSTNSDYSIHRFTEVSRLIPGGSKSQSECIHEAYGVELQATGFNRRVRDAVCKDGDDCDSDGKVNGRCVFPVGFCFKVNDPRFPLCALNNVTHMRIRSKPENSAISTVASRIESALPIKQPTCFYSSGVAVPVRQSKGTKKPGRLNISIKAGTDFNRDIDGLRLICTPAS